MANLVTGLILGVIRLFEPYFLHLMKRYVWGFFGELISDEEMEKKGRYMNDTITTFLTSSLNIELVHIILSTITKKCTKTKVNVDPRNKVLNMQEFEDKVTHTMDQIRISDPKKWEVATLPQFLENKFGFFGTGENEDDS